MHITATNRAEDRSSFRWRQGLIILTLVGGSVIGGASTAVAIDIVSPTGNPRNVCTQQPAATPVSDPGVCRTDNSTWTYYMDSSGEFELEAADRSAVSSGMNAWGNNTIMVVSYDPTPTFSGGAETDVVFQEGLVPTIPVSGGVTWCQDVVDDRPWVCDQHYVRIRGGGVYSPRLVAHEAGHALGLVHGTEARPAVSGTAPTMGIMTTGALPAGLGSTPIAQVNSAYN